MSKAVKDAPPGTDDCVNLPFEEALKRLEGIVDAMENDDLPLETLLAKYEEGTRLAERCQSRLAEAELQVQKLERKASGEIRVQPFPLNSAPA